MNYSMIFYIIGWILNVEAVLMIPSVVVAALYKEKSGVVFAAVIVFSAAVGLLLVRKQPKNKVFYAKEGCVTVALCWIIMSIVGALPFVLSGTIPGIIDALFETVSGFTTTGASILPEVEGLPHCILFWRRARGRR